MSSLEIVQKLLDKDCFCHYSELQYMFQCMPSSIQTPSINNDNGCYHGKATQIRQALNQFKTFLETKSLFKVGDRIEIAEPREIGPGWMSHRHFLIEGSKGTIVQIDYHDEQFGYLVQFDNDTSWIDEKDVIHPNSDQTRRHNFFFREHNLRKADPITARAFLRQLWSEFHKIGD